jgi:hypothetical protein
LENYRLDFQFDYQHKSAWKKIGIQKSKNHTIFTILDKPTEPWGDGSAASEEKPWVSVLDKLCKDWVKDQPDEDITTGKLVEKVFHSGFNYDTLAGASFYTSGLCNRFADLKKWMNGLNGKPLAYQNGKKVNCTDCATVVTSLSNMLGCELNSSRFGYYFNCHKIISIGYTAWAYPFPNPTGTLGGFSYHEIAWKGGCGGTDDIFDACLKVADDPTTSPATNDIYAQKMTYNTYEPKIVWPTSLAAVTPKPGTKIHRNVR